MIITATEPKAFNVKRAEDDVLRAFLRQQKVERNYNHEFSRYDEKVIEGSVVWKQASPAEIRDAADDDVIFATSLRGALAVLQGKEEGIDDDTLSGTVITTYFTYGDHIEVTDRPFIDANVIWDGSSVDIDEVVRIVKEHGSFPYRNWLRHNAVDLLMHCGIVVGKTPAGDAALVWNPDKCRKMLNRRQTRERKRQINSHDVNPVIQSLSKRLPWVNDVVYPLKGGMYTSLEVLSMTVTVFQGAFGKGAHRRSGAWKQLMKEWKARREPTVKVLLDRHRHASPRPEHLIRWLDHEAALRPVKGDLPETTVDSFFFLLAPKEKENDGAQSEGGAT